MNVDISIQAPTIDEEREAGRTVSLQLKIPWKNVSTTLYICTYIIYVC